MNQTLKTPRFVRLTLVASLGALFFVTGCASTSVISSERDYTGQLPQPGHIYVYNFAATAAEVPQESALSGQVDDQTQTAEDVELGRQLGAEIASQLALQIEGMGLPALKADARTRMQVNDIIIRGYLTSIDEGSAVKRVTIGFGSGNSKLTTKVEGFQMTANGLRKLGSGTVESGGNQTSGAALGAAAFIATSNPVGLVVSGGMKVYDEASGKSTIQGRAQATAKEIADQLKTRFQQQGWIP
jgi:hypothetical protein